MSEKPLWTHLSTLPDTFEEVVIVDLDPSKTTWSRIHEDLRVVYLKLNRDPPDLLWTKFFHQERESRTMIRRRGLWIEDGYISFDCLPEEIEPYHLPDIQRSVDFANRKYREYYDMRRREMRASDPVASARGALETMRSRLFRPQDQPTGELPKPDHVMPAPPLDPMPYDAGKPSDDVMLSPEELAAHDAALGVIRETLQPSGAQANAIVKRGEQYRADVLPQPVATPRVEPAPSVQAPVAQAQVPQAPVAQAAVAPAKPAHPNLDAWKAEQAKIGAAPELPAKPAPATKNEVTDQSLEQTLAEYRAKVRAAFDAQKKKT